MALGSCKMEWSPVVIVSAIWISPGIEDHLNALEVPGAGCGTEQDWVEGLGNHVCFSLGGCPEALGDHLHEFLVQQGKSRFPVCK